MGVDFADVVVNWLAAVTLEFGHPSGALLVHHHCKKFVGINKLSMLEGNFDSTLSTPYSAPEHLPPDPQWPTTQSDLKKNHPM
jgi:hypothetical protein